MYSIRARVVNKAFRLYRNPIDSLKEVLLRRSYGETVSAVRDVSFEVAAGGSLGIVGANGAGKSTLLKMLAGALAPTSGSIERHGRVAAMLQLGAGFHPDLSGLENIRVGCAVMGLSPAQTAALMPHIVDFAELGEFIDKPVRIYSSGMYLRLGFAVATASAPDILVVDEHLSVGDQHFRLKCMRRIKALREGGCALVFCSHDMYAIGEVCERTLWLRDGQPAMLADTASVLKAYQDHERDRDGAAAQALPAPAPADPRRSGTVLRDVCLGSDAHAGVIATGQRLTLRITADVSEQAWRDGVHVGIVIVRNDALWCYGISTKMDGLASGMQRLDGTLCAVTFVIDQLPLLSGQYSFTVALMDNLSPLVFDSRAAVAPFAVHHDGKDVGVALLPHRWELA
ncbi:ABC transporter ATP-binding protein [Massilia sp. DWR3-1-1]|uniref:ABC transporter ATP-binding protein n=1 Tax=Massilia sp. DWR3-1-1 TaxID=2804559 RepID=UPI003CF9D432